MIGTSWTQNKTRHVQLGWISLLHEHLMSKLQFAAVCHFAVIHLSPPQNRRILEEQLDTAVDHEVNIKLSRAGEVMNIHLRVVDFHKLLLGATSSILSLPSGNLLHNYGKIHHAINGKIHYFYGNFQ